MQSRPFFFFPVLAIAVVVAILFFKVYGTVSRPDVPLPVSATIDHFSPGLAVAKPAKESLRALIGARWVRDVGYVGAISGDRFAQARLYVESGERSRATGRDRAVVEAVELVSVSGKDMAGVMSDLGIAFRGVPKDGCLVPADDAMPYRRVQYWTTRADRGGVAILSEWSTKDRATPGQGVAVWSLYAWAGPFQGTRTLRARFDPRTCLDLVGT